MKVRVFVGKSRIAGQGLFTLQNIKKDTRVIQYVGERINGSFHETAKVVNSIRVSTAGITQ
jgi:hypothetical protein